ncbi:MAG: glutamate--tRNA ligase [Frankiaceae bacterium]
MRVAPSPTGDPHVGTAYMSLFNLAFAQQQGGAFVLRIEDTDRARYVADSEEQIYRTLRWLGLGWDEGPDVGGPYAPYRQSERLDAYRPHVERLLADGRAYHCWCTPERLAHMREEQQRAKQPTGYDRLCFGKSREERAALPGFSETPVVRMLVPDDAPLSFTDLIRGEVHAPRPDDQVILKADGYPTYHLAVVVDDHDMAITHVVRGEEWISSTPKHLLLYDWLGWERPRFAHMPLLRNADRSKISKRKNPAARLRWFQEQGFLPAALRNFLALMGYSMPDGRETFSFEEMVAEFDWARVNAAGPVFDIGKLDWLNGHYIRELSDDEFLEQARPYLPGTGQDEGLRLVLGSVKERTKRLCEVTEQLDWLYADDLEVPPDLLAKQGLPAVEGAAALADAAAGLERLGAAGAPEPAGIEAELDRVREASGLNRKRFFMTMRVAVTGKPVSPPLHETIAALGVERTALRLRDGAATLRSLGG